VKSGAVIEGLDVIEDGGTSSGAGGEAVVIDQFVFEAAPEGLDKGVIVAVAFAAHESLLPLQLAFPLYLSAIAMIV
jgi:hypothetical protein